MSTGKTNTWRFNWWRSKAFRHNDSIYLLPTVLYTYCSCHMDGRSIEKQSFMLGAKWLKWSIVFHGVNDNTAKAACPRPHR